MKKLYLLATGLATLAPIAGHQDGSGLEEIIVTAQRREQNLQEVPISVSAFSAEQIERENIKGATDYLAQTPNVSFTEDAQAAHAVSASRSAASTTWSPARTPS